MINENLLKMIGNSFKWGNIFLLMNFNEKPVFYASSFDLKLYEQLTFTLFVNGFNA